MDRLGFSSKLFRKVDTMDQGTQLTLLQINSMREKKDQLPLIELPQEYRGNIDINKLSKEEKKYYDCKLLNIPPI